MTGLRRATTLLAALTGLCVTVAAHSEPGQTTQTALSICSTASYWCDSRRGWHFYDDPEPELEAPKAPKPAADRPPPSKDTRAPELIEFEKLQKRLEDTRNIAIINPSEANVRRYMELEAKVVHQASYFADVAQRVAWATPSLDLTLQGRPVNAKALEVFEREEQASRARTVEALAKDHVLFFFFRSDCPYCHAFAPTLQAFEARYGLQVVAISVDGGGLPGLGSFRLDNGIARTLNVTQVPAVFLAQPFTGRITPLGFGVLAESQLLERIAAVTAPGADELLPSAAKRLHQ